MNKHRNIAEALDLFHSEPTAPGMVFWHPNGWELFQKIKAHIRKAYLKSNFQEISTPLFLKRELWELSGHWQKFSTNMFVGGAPHDAPEYALKPMSCPAHLLYFKRDIISYRALPYRIFEFGTVHRNEPSGALNGLMRLRQFTQDDAHVLCRWQDCVDEILSFLERARSIYSDYGYQQLDVRISTRPEDSFGNDEDWQRAEALLREACDIAQINYHSQEGEGAFYGPKIELVLRDNEQRHWQCGTIQLDFNMPHRFGLSYVDEEGKQQLPVMLHQAVYGSLERWLGILLESCQGKLPPWVHPVPVGIASIGAASNRYCARLKEKLNILGLKVEFNQQKQSIGKKIKLFHKQRIPIILIAGDKEVKANQCILRQIDSTQRIYSVEEALDLISKLAKAPNQLPDLYKIR